MFTANFFQEPLRALVLWICYCCNSIFQGFLFLLHLLSNCSSIFTGESVLPVVPAEGWVFIRKNRNVFEDVIITVEGGTSQRLSNTAV